jgi:hypothetical protein
VAQCSCRGGPSSRSSRGRVAVGATLLDAMVLEGNELGQALWEASGYIPQAEWRRWIKPVAG